MFRSILAKAGGKNKIAIANNHHVVASSHRPPSVSPPPISTTLDGIAVAPPFPLFPSVLSQANQSHSDGHRYSPVFGSHTI